MDKASPPSEQVATVLKKSIFMIGSEHPMHVDLG